MNDRPTANAADPAAIAREDGSLDGGAILRLLDRPLSADDLRTATDGVAQPLVPPQQDTMRLVLFEMGCEQLAVPALAVSRVVPTTSVHGVPHRTNRIFRGLCNIDGELMLCGDLARLLGMPEQSPGDAASTESPRRFVVLGPSANRWAVEVASVNRVIVVSPATLQRPPVTVAAALGCFATHLVPLKPSLVALLDADKIVTAFQAALS